MQKLIQIIEDHEDIQQLLQVNLQSAGYKTLVSGDGLHGLNSVEKNLPDLVLLDLMLPALSGLQVCQRLKKNKNTLSIPIIMVSAKGTEEDIVTGLELGADDYVTKPFTPKILLARIESVLRRQQRKEVHEPTDQLNIHQLSIHPGKREVFLAGKVLQLTYSEFAIIHLLVQRPGWVFTRKQIVNEIRGHGYAVTERSVDVQIVGLRKKLAEHENYIETIRGVGYRFLENS